MVLQAALDDAAAVAAEAAAEAAEAAANAAYTPVSGPRAARLQSFRDGLDDPAFVAPGRPPEQPEPPLDEPAIDPRSMADMFVQLTALLEINHDTVEEQMSSMSRRIDALTPATMRVRQSWQSQPATAPATSAPPVHQDVVRNDVQSALQEESERSSVPVPPAPSGDFRNDSRSARFAATPSGAPPSAAPPPSAAVPSRAPRATPSTSRRNTMTALSPGPGRPTGGSSPYPSDDPPVATGMRGYGAPPRPPFSGHSLHLRETSPSVCWSVPSHDAGKPTKGPYGGNHDRFMKFSHKLPGDATTELMLLFNFLRTQFQASGFHPGLLPDIAEIHPHVDLSRSPVDALLMSNRDIPEWSDRQYWVDQHRQLGFSLHRVLAVVAKDSSASAPIFCRTVSEQSINGDGFAVLNELLRLHFPHVHGTRAPSFDTTSAGKIVQGPDEPLSDYERRFTLWLQSLRLCGSLLAFRLAISSSWLTNSSISSNSTPTIVSMMKSQLFPLAFSDIIFVNVFDCLKVMPLLVVLI
jgi:hypothetical protein